MRRAAALLLSLAVGCREAPQGAAGARATDDLPTARDDVRDASTPPDLPSATDALATDLPAPQDVLDATADALPDGAPPQDPCAAGRVLDLDALGTRAGATVRVVGSNAAAARRATIDAPCALGYAGHVVVYRFTPRARGRLRVTTNRERTDARLDTVVFALSACAAADAGARSLGCGDDTGDPPRDHASTFVTDEDVTAGVPVFLAVGGFLHATRELFDSQGTFELEVTEQALE